MITFNLSQSLPSTKELEIFSILSIAPPIEMIQNRMSSMGPIDVLTEEGEALFDLDYASFLLSNEIMFKNFFKIMNSHRMGNDVVIMVNRYDEFECMLMESLNKFIQQRYGIFANTVNEPMDLDYREFTDASRPDILMQDNERYIAMTIPKDIGDE